MVRCLFAGAVTCLPFCRGVAFNSFSHGMAHLPKAPDRASLLIITQGIGVLLIAGKFVHP